MQKFNYDTIPRYIYIYRYGLDVLKMSSYEPPPTGVYGKYVAE